MRGAGGPGGMGEPRGAPPAAPSHGPMDPQPRFLAPCFIFFFFSFVYFASFWGILGKPLLQARLSCLVLCFPQENPDIQLLGELDAYFFPEKTHSTVGPDSTLFSFFQEKPNIQLPSSPGSPAWCCIFSRKTPISWFEMSLMCIFFPSKDPLGQPRLSGLMLYFFQANYNIQLLPSTGSPSQYSLYFFQ